MANEYKSYFRTIGTSPYVAGITGTPEVHCILGEYAFCKAMRTAQTNGGPKEVLDTTLFIKGQASEIQHFFPGASVMDDGSVAVNCSLWGEEAKKVDAEAVAADQAGCKRNVRVAMAGYLYMDTYQKDGQQRMSLKFKCDWLASAKAKKPKQNGQSYGGQQQYGNAPQYNGQQYGNAPQYNGQQYGNAPQYNGQQYANAPQYNGQQYQQPAPAQQYQQPAPVQQYQQPAQAPQYQQPAQAQQYQQPAPAQQYQQPAPAQQYQQPAPAQQPMQPAPAQQPMQPAQAQPPMPPVPAQQSMQPAPAQYAGAPGNFAIIQDDDDEELPF